MMEWFLVQPVGVFFCWHGGFYSKSIRKTLTDFWLRLPWDIQILFDSTTPSSASVYCLFPRFDINIFRRYRFSIPPPFPPPTNEQKNESENGELRFLRLFFPPVSLFMELAFPFLNKKKGISTRPICWPPSRDGRTQSFAVVARDDGALISLCVFFFGQPLQSKEGMVKFNLGGQLGAYRCCVYM